MNADEEFINVFNEFYPFEKYIVKTPKPINYLFDDLLLIELFIPNTKLEPILYDKNGTKDILAWTEINKDEIYVKVKGVAGESRLAYYDFASHIREGIRRIIIEDFGGYEWQSLYCADEDEELPELEKVLNEQKSLIKAKYGECFVKPDSPNAYLIHA
jgi:hypothetical protein